MNIYHLNDIPDDLKGYFQPVPQIGLEATPEEYIAKLVEIFREVRRVMRKDGTVFLNLGDSYYTTKPSGPQGQTGQRADRTFTAVAAGGVRQHARSYGSDGIAQSGSLVLDPAYSDFCGECRAAVSSRTERNGRPPRAVSSPLLPTDRDSAHSDSVGELPPASPRGVPVSTIAESGSPQRAECSHCDNCGVCLQVLRSSSRDGRLCVRRAGYTDGTVLPASDGHSQGTDVSGMAWLNYTTLKPKDLVGMPWRVAFALQADGWWLRRDIIWAKPNPMPESVTDRCTTAHEYLFHFAKSDRYYYDAEAIREMDTGSLHDQSRKGRATEDQKRSPTESVNGIRRSKMPDGWATYVARHGSMHDDGRETGRPSHIRIGRNRRSVWVIATQPYPEAHFATFPEALVKPCVLAGAPIGGLVLDPFSGSGTTLYVAKDLGRKAIGIELKPEYNALAVRRLQQEVLPFHG